MSKSHPDVATNYRPDIDGLRAIAVLTVVGFHAFPEYFPGGFIGVDIFFVISGFLITRIILENLAQKQFSFTNFYAKRIRRIFPALLIVLLSSYVIGFAILFADELVSLGHHIVGGAGFFSNLLLWSEAGYFDARSIEKPLLHLWSLGIEEQFYIFWPPLLWACWKIRISPIYAICILATASLIWCRLLTQSDPVQAFYSPLSRCWELCIGALLAYSDTSKHVSAIDEANAVQKSCIWLVFPPIKFTDIQPIASFLGFVFLLISVALITANSAFPGFWALLPTLGAALLIVSGPNPWFNRVLAHPLPVKIGLISYPMYLWHWPILVYAYLIWGGIPSMRWRALLMLGCIVAAWLTYRLVEKPLRYGANLKLKTWLLIISMLILGITGSQTQWLIHFIQRTGINHIASFNQNDTQYKSCKDLSIVKDAQLDICVLGTKSKEPTAVILGDSHAEDKFAGIERADLNQQWLVLGNSTCPPALLVNTASQNTQNCQEKMAHTIEWIIQNSSIKQVVLSFFWNVFLESNFAADHLGGGGPENIAITSTHWPNQNKEDLLFAGLNETITRLEKAHKQVIIAIDVPELPFRPKDCYRASRDCTQKLSQVLGRQQQHRLMLEHLAKLHPALKIYDPTNLFCNSSVCFYQDGHSLLYRDSHHLSYAGSMKYGNTFIEWLNTMEHSTQKINAH